MADAASPGPEDREPPISLTRGFLFADLRGYTQFAESHGAVRASQLIERYRALVRTAVTRFRGAEIKTEGDSFYVVFDAVSSAVGCGLAIAEAEGVDADQVRAAVRAAAVDPSHRYDTILGSFHFDANGDTSQQFVTLYRVDPTAAGGKGDWVIEKEHDFGPAP